MEPQWDCRNGMRINPVRILLIQTALQLIIIWVSDSAYVSEKVLCLVKVFWAEIEILGCMLPLFELQVTGEHVIVVKNISSFVNGHSPHLSTPLQPQQYRLKVAARSSGPNLTQRSETTQPERNMSPKQMSDVKYNLQFSLKYAKMLEEKIHRWNNSRALQKTLTSNFLLFWLQQSVHVLSAVLQYHY